MTDILRPEGRTKEGKNIYRLLLRGNILTDCVCAFFLTAGICQAFLPMTILYNGTGDTLRAAALCILALALLRMRWWIGPLLTSLAALGLCWHFYRTDQLSGLLSYWGAFFAAVFRDGAVDYDIPTGSLPLTVLQYSAVFGIALVLFFILRRMFSVWLLLIALGVSMAAADIYAHFPIDLVPPMAMYIIGLVILLPRVYSRYIKRPRAAMQMIAVPGAVLVVLLGLLITPESRDYARWRGMTNFFHDVGYLIDSPFYSHYQGYTNFGLGSFGYEPVPERMGGPAVLPDWHLLTVVSKHPVLLRGAVMDTYTGSSWQSNTHDGDYRFDSLFFRRQRDYAFDLDMPPGDTDARGLYNAVTSEISFAVTYEAEHYTTLFTSSGTADIAFSNPAMRPDAFFNLRSELYLPYPVPQGSTVFITARMFDTGLPGFDDNLVLLEQLAGMNADVNYAGIRERFTALPENLPISIINTALEIAGDEASPYLRATAIARWLGENFTYTLNPAMPPSNVDFVEYFLQTGEGYCTYYASAMAVLSRAAGIPARYVTGFALERDLSQADTFYATGRSAHAWVEIYLYGIGWLTIDPLMWNADAPLTLNREQGDLSFIGGWFEEEEDEYLGDVDWSGVVLPFVEAQPVDMRPFVYGTLILLAAGLTAYICIGWNSKYRRYTPSRAMRSFPDTTARFGFYYADIMLQLSILDAPPLAGETLLLYPMRVDKRIGISNSGFHAIAQAQMKLHFAHITPSPADVETAWEFHTLLEDMLRESLSPPAYIWRRIIAKR